PGVRKVAGEPGRAPAPPGRDRGPAEGGLPGAAGRLVPGRPPRLRARPRPGAVLVDGDPHRPAHRRRAVRLPRLRSARRVGADLHAGLARGLVRPGAVGSGRHVVRLSRTRLLTRRLGGGARRGPTPERHTKRARWATVRMTSAGSVGAGEPTPGLRAPCGVGRARRPGEVIRGR